MKIYIYLKTHNQSGLKYIGQTTQDPFVYKGSGIRWLNHIRKHGYDVTTEILKECSSYDEVKFYGYEISKQYNIVESSDFANLINETGHHFKLPSNFDEINKRRSNTMLRRKKKWLTNGVSNIFIDHDAPTPEGYVPGRTWPDEKTVSEETKGKMREAALNRPRKSRTVKIKQCEYCNSDFELPPNNKNKRFCNASCSALNRSRSHNPKGRNQHSAPK